MLAPAVLGRPVRGADQARSHQGNGIGHPEPSRRGKGNRCDCSEEDCNAAGLARKFRGRR